MSGAGEQRTVPPMQSLRAALVLSRREQISVIVAVLLIGAAALLPVFGKAYWLSIGISVAMFTVLATSWTLFSGPTKYIALSTAAFFGIGMYVVGAGLPYMPFAVLVVLAAVAGALLAAVVGLATLRISGVYFVIFTLGLAELVRQIVAWAQHVMGTSSGLYVLISISDSVMYWLLLGWPRWSIWSAGSSAVRGSALRCASSATTRSWPSTAALIPPVPR